MKSKTSTEAPPFLGHRTDMEGFTEEEFFHRVCAVWYLRDSDPACQIAVLLTIAASQGITIDLAKEMVDEAVAALKQTPGLRAAN